MNKQELREAIYKELFNELHKKSHKDSKGRDILKDKKIRDTDTPAYFSPWSSENKKDKDLEEALNKSDAQYTMKMVFDNHGFGKALKKMKILRSGITLNMSSYMGPSKTLDKMVDEFNSIMGTKYKADKDSFQKGHVTSIDLKEGKLNEAKFTKVHAAKAMKLVKGTSVDKIIPKGDILYVNYTSYKDRAKIAKAVGQLYKYDSDGRSTNAPRGIIGLGGANWMSFINEMSATAKKHGKFGGTGVPFPTEKPNEFAYIDFAKYVKKNEKKIMKSLRGAVPGKIFPLLQMLWGAWDNKANDGAFSNVKGNKFGRELALMLRKDGLVFDNSGNKITNIKEATSLWKHFDMLQNLRMDSMDLEDDMRGIAKELSQTHKDMEQEAEPEGGPKATRYGKQIEKLEKEYKKKKAEFKKLMAKIDKLDQF